MLRSSSRPLRIATSMRSFHEIGEVIIEMEIERDAGITA
jgi:hypothetical protein